MPPHPHPDRAHTPTWVEYDVSAENPLRDALLTSPLSLSQGRLALPDAPGLGVEIDEERLRELRIDG